MPCLSGQLVGTCEAHVNRANVLNVLIGIYKRILCHYNLSVHCVTELPQKTPRVLQNLICEAKVRCGSCGTPVELDGSNSHEMVCKGKENEPLDGNGLVLATTSWQLLQHNL